MTGAGRPRTALILFLSSIAVYSAAWALLGSFEKRAVPEDFNRRYLPIARGILERGDFLLDGRAPSPPIYPMVLAGLTKSGKLFRMGVENAARALNALAMSLLAVLFHAMVQREMGGRAAAVAAMLWITYPFGAYLALQPGPEPLYLLALALAARAALAAARPGPQTALAAGIAGTMPMMVKPMALFLPLVLLGFLIFAWIGRRAPFKAFTLSCSLFIAGSLIAILPWEAYLWQRTGKFVPVADKAGSSLYDGWTFGLHAGAGGDRIRLPGDVEKYMQEVERLNAGKGSGEVLSAVSKAAGKHPGAFIKLLLIKAGRCWYGTDEMWHEKLILGIQAFYLLLSTMGAVLWLRKGRPGGALAAVLSCLLLYHWAAATAALSILRYMMPAFLLVSVMASMAAWPACAATTWRHIKKLSSGK